MEPLSGYTATYRASSSVESFAGSIPAARAILPREFRFPRAFIVLSRVLNTYLKPAEEKTPTAYNGRQAIILMLARGRNPLSVV